MRKLFLTLILVLCGAAVMQAKPVDKALAARVAENVLKKQVVDATPEEFVECRLFVGADGKGFALVAADDCVRPLLAYSPDGTFDPDHMPVHVAAWIDGYRREIASVVAADVTPSPQVIAEWERYRTTMQASNHASKQSSVAPLLTTRWAQGNYYNLHCPYDTIDSIHCYTGCVATAMAQIMRYWNYPEIGWGEYSYTHPVYGSLSADFGHEHYRWERMPDTLNAACDSFQVDAVATLMYHAGVAVAMNYGTGSSGATDITRSGLDLPCAENALKTYFRYNPFLFGSYKASFGDTEWDSMLRVELDAARPVFYSGLHSGSGAHAFVLDGYDTLGMFHVNWGWGGYYDAYYTVDSLSPGAGSMGGTPVYTFNSNNKAIFAVYPFVESTDTVVTVDISVNDTTLGYIEGNGSYQLYDTVTVIPHAAEGCRYLRMNGGKRNIPFSFLATNDLSDTVAFERIEGDTIGYCGDNSISAWRDDYGSTTEWGIRIPPVMRQARQLTAVQLYVYMGADFTMNIYEGDSIDGATPVYTGQYYFTDEEVGWNTLPLDSMLTFHHSKVIWITFSVTAGSNRYPASEASYCGNSDGCWYHLPDGWHPFAQEDYYYTWMIRAVFNPFDRYHVAAAPSNINAGDVTGMGFYAPGDVVTLNAIPKNGYRFAYWSNGSTDNPLHFVVTRDTTFIAFFESPNGIVEIENSKLKIEISGLALQVENPGGLPLDLYDISGRHLATSELSIFNYQFSIPGVYLLRSGTITQKIVAIPHQSY